MSHQPETNPHFVTPNSQFPCQGPTTPHYEDQQDQLPPVTPAPRSQPHQERQNQAFQPNLRLGSTGTPGTSDPRRKKSKPQRKPQPLGAWAGIMSEGTQGQNQLASPPMPPQSSPERRAEVTEQKFREQPLRRPRLVPQPTQTKPFAWLLAGFCAIFWVVIILGGLIVLIVYLVFRPRSPQFDVPVVSLNAAYLDMDAMLNADLTVLAKFTNPNKKVKVDFSYVVLDLYYGNTLIASQYVEPFSAMRNESKLANVHLVTSQVRLPVGEIQRLRREISKNAVMFEFKGVFRARSNLGSFLRYSYWLYGHCTVLVTGPPSGVIKARKCKTKR